MVGPESDFTFQLILFLPRNNSYFFPIKSGLVGSDKTINLPCKCGTTRFWKPPHDHIELYCEGCGSKFSLLELSGEGSYIFTGEGPVRIIGAEGPQLTEQQRVELHREIYEGDVQDDLEFWTAERLLALPDETRLVLVALAAFRKPCPLSTLNLLLPGLSAEKIDDVLRQLQRDKLILCESGSYSVAEAIRDRAHDLIPNPNESRLDRLTLHKSIADSYASQRKPQDQWFALADITPQVEEVHHRLLANQADKAAIVFKDIVPDLLNWGNNKTVIELGERLRSELADTSESLSSVLHSLGLAYMNIGDFHHAREKLEAALEITPSQNKGRVGAMLGNLGCVYFEFREYPRAIECHERALELSRLTQNRRAEGDDLGNLGNVFAALGDYRRAIEYQTQAFDIAREVKNRTGEGNCLMNLGHVHRLNGDIQLGITLIEQSLPIQTRTTRQKGGSSGFIQSRHRVRGTR